MTSFSYLDAAARQAATLDEVDHRPWPLRDSPWTQAETQLDVCFAHWRVGLDALARLLPPELALDTYDGHGWLGIVSSRLSSLRLLGLPPVPRLSVERLDIRTYVTTDDRPGIWLYSVDASNPLLVELAKRVQRLPAYVAQIAATTDGDADGATCTSETARDGLAFKIGCRASGEAFTAEPGSLEHFLTERYCLYTADGGRLYRSDLHHVPWRLQHAEATIGATTLVPITLEGKPHVLFAAAQDMLVWPPEEA